MDIIKTLALLKRLLDDAPRLKRLASNPKNKELPAWDNEVKRLIKETFGRDSKEYARYDGIILLKWVETQEDKEHAYIDHVSQREKALRDIIQEHDIPAKVGANGHSRGNVKAELEHFYAGFVRYKELVLVKKRGELTSDRDGEFQTLSVELQRQFGSLKEVIEKYGGPAVVLLQGGSYKCEAFSSAFNYTIFEGRALDAVMDTAITTLNMAIGNLKNLLESEQLPQEAVSPSGKPDYAKAIKDIVAADPKRVFVVHGRNEDARVAMFTFLRSIGLEPIEWSEAIRLTGKATPYIGEVLDIAFSHAQAILVLLTGDDFARLGNRFTNLGEKDEELAPQARPNVIFEAGLAFGRNPDRTVLVQLGSTRPLSDLAGRHSIVLDNNVKKRQELASRLHTAGCAVQIEHKTDWHAAGDFDKALLMPDKSETTNNIASGMNKPKSKAQELIIKQVNELRTNLANALQASDPVLERTYRIEYIKLLESAITQWMQHRTIFNQLLLLKAEIAGFDINILKSDKLATIKWGLNSVEKMLTILQI